MSRYLGSLGSTDSFGSLGATAADDFCSPTHPMGTCKPVAGQCKPMTKAALTAFRTFQGQLNRAATARKLPTTGVDGVIGKGTLALYNKLAISGFTRSSCDQLARDVLIGSATAMMKSIADQAGVAAVVKSPATSQAGAEAVAQANPGSSPEDFYSDESIVDKAVGFLSSPWGIGGAALLAAGALFLVLRKRKPKKNPGRRRRARRNPTRRKYGAKPGSKRGIAQRKRIAAHTRSMDAADMLREMPRRSTRYVTGDGRRFATLEAAKAHAQYVADRTGAIIAIEGV